MTETFHAGTGLGRLSDVTIIHGDCLEAMAELAADSVDAIVTDPPYGLEFMGKDWDSFAPQNTTAQRSNAGGFGDDETKPWNKARSGTKGVRTTFRCRSCNGWSGSFSEARAARQKECKCDRPDLNYAGAPPQTVAFGKWCELWTTEALRVLKPGGHLLAFGGTRTWHRLAVAVEDAGFEIRDSIAWLYGSGFPKSLDVSKAIDKAAGATREVVGLERTPWKGSGASITGVHGEAYRPTGEDGYVTKPITAPATPESEQWSGFGTALKPAFEPVVVARKPLAKGTVAANVLAHGTGALNIDACRIGTESRPVMVRTSTTVAASSMSGTSTGATSNGEMTTAGRWPANVVLDADQAAALDEQSGYQKDGVTVTRNLAKGRNSSPNGIYGKTARDPEPDFGYGGGGGASRFFYVAKAPKKERPVVIDADGKSHSHSTVKPLTLMRWLVRLVTPPGGVVLDPFAGSGTTVEATLLEDFRVIGIEREADYLPMIQQRIARCLNS